MDYHEAYDEVEEVNVPDELEAFLVAEGMEFQQDEAVIQEVELKYSKWAEYQDK